MTLDRPPAANEKVEEFDSSSPISATTEKTYIGGDFPGSTGSCYDPEVATGHPVPGAATGEKRSCNPYLVFSSDLPRCWCSFLAIIRNDLVDMVASHEETGSQQSRSCFIRQYRNNDA